jgi:hypothetical protein
VSTALKVSQREAFYKKKAVVPGRKSKHKKKIPQPEKSKKTKFAWKLLLHFPLPLPLEIVNFCIMKIPCNSCE